MPLHQQDQLWNIAGPEPDGALLFGPPSRSVDHQALFLDTDGDVLLGRAENGESSLAEPITPRHEKA